jgi:hypothetical protein
MSEWLSFDQWPDCVSLERPGILFEVRNDAGQSLLTTCTVPLPVPTNWTSPPTGFRPVPAERPRHSNPIPKPGAPR